jgi:serine/threonine protein kinase
MAARPVTCPSAETLRAFSLGKLDDLLAEAVMSHLEGCADCRAAAEDQPTDSFLDRVRAAVGGHHTRVPDKSLSGVARSLPSAAPVPAVAGVPNLPPELATHPHYEIVRELGRGGMGVVYLAHNRLMNRPEVLKVMNKEILDRPGAKERFLREIQSAARLNHPHVVAAYTAAECGDLLVLAMEYVEGVDLAQLVKTRGPQRVDKACYYARQAAQGLQHAHEKGMVHRDIKPHNLIRTLDGKEHIVKVLDFGLAKATSEKAGGRELTGTGQMLGTPDYVAPEQLLDATTADIRADIYSLGCTLYYLLSSGPPFTGRSAYEVMEGHRTKEAQPLNLVRPEVPEELAAVVRKMMAKDPAKRYQTPKEVARALKPFIWQEAKGAPGEPSRELSLGAAETATPKCAKTDPVVPAAAPPVEKQPAATPREDHGGGRGGMWVDIQMSPPTARPKSVARQHRRSKPGSMVMKTGLIAAGLVACLLLLALLVLRAAGVFKDGTLEPVNSAASPDDKPNAKKRSLPETEPSKPELKTEKAIARGVQYLKDQQFPDGTWQHYPNPGATALAGLTLLECGVPVTDPAIQKAAATVRTAAVQANHTYSMALAILFLDRLGEPVDVALIESLTVQLLAGQNPLGCWDYWCPMLEDPQEVSRLSALVRKRAEQGTDRNARKAEAGKRSMEDLPKEMRARLEQVHRQQDASKGNGIRRSDNSNTQFATMGLWVGRRYGLPVEEALGRIDAHFRKSQNADGGWSYQYTPGVNADSIATMTAAGLFGLAVARAAADLKDGKARLDPAQDAKLKSALDALGSRTGHPVGKNGGPIQAARGTTYYFLWSLERVCMALDLDKIDGKDWYEWSAEILLDNQEANGGWNNGAHRGGPDTCFALLVLKRANLSPDLTGVLKGSVH